MRSVPIDTPSDESIAQSYSTDAPPASSPLAAGPRRSSRPIQPVSRLEYHTLGCNAVTADVSHVLQVIRSCFNVYSDSSEPNTYDEAISGSDSVDNGNWQHVVAPSDAPLLKCRWVHKIKRDESGNVMKYKARLVAKGFTQQHGVNFFETF